LGFGPKPPIPNPQSPSPISYLIICKLKYIKNLNNLY